MQQQHYGSGHSSHSPSPNHKHPHTKKKKRRYLASSTLSSYSPASLAEPTISKNYEKLQTNLLSPKRRGGDFGMEIPNILNTSSTRFAGNFQRAERKLQRAKMMAATTIAPEILDSFIISLDLVPKMQTLNLLFPS